MNSEPVMVLMSAIEYRKELNPRDNISTAVISDYVRDVKNGKVLPPIEVHRGKAVLFDGAQRFHAYKEFYGDGWREEKIAVIWRDDLPDPDEQPTLFRAEAALCNGMHGLRMTRFERRKTLADLARERGQEVMLKYASGMSETAESAMELVAALVAPRLVERPKTQQTDLAVVLDNSTPQQVSGRVEAEPNPAPAQQRVAQGVRFRSETIPTGHLQPVLPVIKNACRRLREALDLTKGDLTEADLAELRVVCDRIWRVLGETGKSTH